MEEFPKQREQITCTRHETEGNTQNLGQCLRNYLTYLKKCNIVVKNIGSESRWFILNSESIMCCLCDLGYVM